MLYESRNKHHKLIETSHLILPFIERELWFCKLWEQLPFSRYFNNSNIYNFVFVTERKFACYFEAHEKFCRFYSMHYITMRLNNFFIESWSSTFNNKNIHLLPKCSPLPVINSMWYIHAIRSYKYLSNCTM